MDSILDFDELSRDSSLLVRLEALGKLTLVMLNGLESASSAPPGQQPGVYLGGPGLPSYMYPLRWGALNALGLKCQRDAWLYYDRFNRLGSFVLGAD